MEKLNINQAELLKFLAFNSCINPSFWFELNRIKLDEYKLNDSFQDITGYFNNCRQISRTFFFNLPLSS
jgi:hypothetical protein